jgi:hypothetical protein
MNRIPRGVGGKQLLKRYLWNCHNIWIEVTTSCHQSLSDSITIDESWEITYQRNLKDNYYDSRANSCSNGAKLKTKIFYNFNTFTQRIYSLLFMKLFYLSLYPFMLVLFASIYSKIYSLKLQGNIRTN